MADAPWHTTANTHAPTARPCRAMVISRARCGLKDPWDKIFFAKYGLDPGLDPHRRYLSFHGHPPRPRPQLRVGCDRLFVDRCDVYYMHRVLPRSGRTPPVEDGVER